MSITKTKIEQLKRTVKTLKLMGCLKCSICNVWVDKSFVFNGVCNECIHHKKDDIKWI